MKPLGLTLTTTRERLGFNQKSVGEKMGLSASLISKWEKEERAPDIIQMIQLSRIYGVTVDYLQGQATPVIFQSRAQTTLSAEEKAEIGSALNDAAQQIHFLKSAWDKTNRTPSRFSFQLEWSDPAMVDHVDMVRQLLKLKRSIALAELKQALAENNIHVFEWYLPAKLSGLSYHDQFSVIFLNRSLPDPQRLFTLSHELAHIIYHLRENKTQVSDLSSRNEPEEKQANRWASEFLMPQRLLEKRVLEFGKMLYAPAVFNRLAQEWNVSPEALFYRLVQMEKMRWPEKNRYFTSSAKNEKSHSNRVDEIDNQVAPEMINAGFLALNHEKISAAKLSEWWFTSVEEVDEFLFKLEEPSSLESLGLDESA